MSVLSKVSLCFYQAFLGFPLKYISESGTDRKLTFSRSVFWWGSTLTFIQTGFLSASIYAQLSADDNQSTTKVSITTLIISVMFTEVAIFLSSAMKYPKFIDIYNTLERFDNNLQLVPPKSWKKIKFTSLVVILTVTPVLVEITGTLILLLSDKHFKNIIPRILTLVSFRIATCRQGCMLVQFHEITNCIATRFRLINARIRQEVIIHSYRQSMRHHNLPHMSHSPDTRSVSKIKSFMSAYQMLCDAAYKANSFYADILTSLFFCKFMYVTVTLFMFFLLLKRENVSGTVLTAMWALCHICYLLMIVSSSSDVTQAADETVPIICKLINRHLDPVLKRRLESFLLQLSTQNVALTGRGLFQITREMLTTMAATVTTNLPFKVRDRSAIRSTNIKLIEVRGKLEGGYSTTNNSCNIASALKVMSNQTV
ncbi:gustatory receptor [Homalodisca vitripennis]|nr:gustatory receptor [Homalodisca vitripennis]